MPDHLFTLGGQRKLLLITTASFPSRIQSKKDDDKIPDCVPDIA